ncbi:LiaF transmembrane domain-containing protein [Bacteroides sp.]
MEKKSTSPSGFTGRQLAATILIVCGVLLLGRNLGLVSYDLFRVIVSWPMLLIVLGAYSFLRKQAFTGIILFAIGFCFILPRLGWLPWAPAHVSAVLWPVLLVCIGIAFFYHPRRVRTEWKMQGKEDFTTREHKSGDGFVRSDNVFGGVKQVVLDEVFKGAEIRNSFGGTVLDLRRTNIEQGETYIDVECNFGGVEIYVPSDWRVDLQANAFLGGCEDKRVTGVNIDRSRTLVVIGNVSFGGVEIKG